MVNRDFSDAKSQNLFRVHHIASFVEGEHSLKPEEVVRHLKTLQSSKRIEETPCVMKLDSRGIRIKLENTKETVESFEWVGIKNQAAVLNPMENFQFKYLVLFRLLEAKEKISELHVFSCETTSAAKAFVDALSYHKKNIRDNWIIADSSPRLPVRRGRSETKVNTVVDAYGQHFYMLNRCIDDIESFERRLEKGIKKRATSKSTESIDSSRQQTYKIPSTSEFIEAVRKVKYAFNTNEAIRPYTPDRTSKKIFIRLFNTVHWLDEVCKSGCVPEYNSHMVSDVVEPLLNEDTIRAIMERLAPRKQEFWRGLGKAWNVPSEQWPNPCNRYMPQFDSPSSDDKSKRLYSYDKPSSSSNLFRSPSLGTLPRRYQPDSSKLHSPGHSPPSPIVERIAMSNPKASDIDERKSPTRVITDHRPALPGPSVIRPTTVSSPVEISWETQQERQPSPIGTSGSVPIITTEIKSESPVVHTQTPRATQSNASIPQPTNLNHAHDTLSKVQQNSPELYCVTIRHVSAKSREISVSPGTVVEVLDKSQIDWWVVKDPHGSEGEIPKWKLKPYNADTTSRSNRQSFPGAIYPHKTTIVNRESLRDQTAVSQLNTITTNDGVLAGTIERVFAVTSLDQNQTAPITVPINQTIGSIRNSEAHIKTTPSVDNHVTPQSISMTQSLSSNRTGANEVERVISIAKSNDTQSTARRSPTSFTNSTPAQSVPPGNMLYMTSDQLQEIMRSSENLAQVPMVLVPVSELYKYASQSNVNVNSVNGQQQQFGPVSYPMQWPDFYELGNRPPSPGTSGATGMSEWRPAPLVPTGSLEGIGFSPYPFNYPTHTHTMTRELRERLSKMREGGGSGLKSVPSPTTSNEKAFGRLTKYASKDDITEWLVARRFPPNVISSLKGFNGMDLYTMSRQQLAEHVGYERCDEIFYAFRGT